MKILLLGGTGAMGTHLSKILHDRGDDVYITSRKKYNSQTGLTYLQGDAHDKVFLQTILTDPWDAIIDFLVYTTEEFKERVNILLNSTNQYLFLSSSRVYANQDNLITEESPRLLDTIQDKEYLKTDEYALRKAREEDLLNNSGKTNFTIIRPYITYSEQRLQLGIYEKEKWLYRALKGRTIIFSSDIIQHFTTLTYGLDVAVCMSKLIGNISAHNKTYSITTSKSIKWEDVLNVYLSTIENITGVRPKVKLIDYPLEINNASSKYQILYDRRFNRRFDNSKIVDICNNYVFCTPEEGLKKCLTSFIAQPQFKPINFLAEAKVDKITHELTSLTEISGLKNKISYLLCRFTHYFEIKHFIYNSLYEK